MNKPKFEVLPKHLRSRHVPGFVPSKSLQPISEVSPPPTNYPPVSTNHEPISSSSSVPDVSVPGTKPIISPSVNNEGEMPDIFDMSPRTIQKMEEDLNKIKLVLKRDPHT